MIPDRLRLLYEGIQRKKYKLQLQIIETKYTLLDWWPLLFLEQSYILVGPYCMTESNQAQNIQNL